MLLDLSNHPAAGRERMFPGRPLAPIVKGSGLYLEAFGHGDDGRFAAVFLSTWRRLPLRARRRMLAHWRRPSGSRLLACLPTPDGRGISPRVQLLNGWDRPTTGLILTRFSPEDWEACKAERAGVRVGFGAVLAEGHLLRFWAPAFDRMPDDVAAHLIAHELAHVYQHAAGDGQFPGGPPDQCELEEDADELICLWGFGDAEVFDQWAAEVGLAKVITFASVEDMLRHQAEYGDRYTPPAG